MKKTLLALLLLGGVIAGIRWREDRLREKNGEMKLFGNVDIRQVLLGFRVSGRLEAMCFEEGEKVAPGELLGILDAVPYKIKRAEAQANLRQARANLEKMKRGYRSEELRQAVAQRDRIKALLALAEKDYGRLFNLFKQDAVAGKDLDTIAAERDRLRAELAAAEAALDQTREGYRAEDIGIAEAAVELAEAQLDEAENALGDTKLYAPSKGTILTRMVEPGTVVAAGQTVYAVMLESPVRIRAYVSETQLGRVHLGMKWKIFTDSHLDPLEGIVCNIASEAEFTPKQVQTEDLRTDLVFRIRLLVTENREDRLKNGMPVTLIPEEPAKPLDASHE